MDDLLSTIQSANPNAPPAAAAAPQSAAPAPSGGFDPTKSYGTPPQLLDNLQAEESSGNPLAVNKTTQAMGPYQFTPSTVAALRQQGVKFDPFDPQQARAAADYYIQQLKAQNGGTYQGALKAYGGFKTADPTQYIAKAMNGVAPEPTAPGQSNSGAQPQGYTGPTSDLFATLQQGAQQKPAPAAPAQPVGEGMPTKPMAPVTAAQNGSTWSDLAEKGVGNLASSVIGMAGAGARMVGANDFADQAQAARAQIEQKMQADTNNSTAGKVTGVIGGTVPYAAMGGASIPGAMAGGAAAGALPAIADNQSGAQVVRAGAGGAAMGLGAGLAGKAVGAVVPAMAHLFGGSGGEEAAAAVPAGAQVAGATGRGSVGAAGTSFAQQAAAEGVPEPLVQKIASAEQSGSLNPVAAGRHIEAGSLPVPIELTAGQASGDVHALSNELNARAKNPALADRFNAQNGQIAENLAAIRDQISPNVNVPSGTPTGQALVDAYKTMDQPITEQISEQYAKARGADGAPALVNAAPQMQDFAAQVGPTRFNALPANVQQIFRDAAGNQVTLPAGFEVNGSSTRPMNVGDLMDIDKTLSGAMRSATDGSVRHDIGALRDSIVNSQLDPSSAGADAFSAYKTAQASARARFQAMDADPAYKAAVNDATPAGEPSPLADDFARKYIAGGKTSNVQNMMQNLSNDPANKELMAGALMDHITSQAGVDLRTGTGNISQAGLNKAIQNLGDKTRIVLGPDASQTVEKLGNVARYTQEQPRGSYVNNSNTAVTLMGHAGGLAKSVVERGVNAVVPGAQLGSWGREALAGRANAREIARSLEPGAGLNRPSVQTPTASAGERAGTKLSTAVGATRESVHLQNATDQNGLLGDQSPGVPLNSLLRKTRGNP